MNERLFEKESEPLSTNSKFQKLCDKVISIDELRRMQQENLLDCLKVIASNKQCAHDQLESHLASPMEPEAYQATNRSLCDDACPACKGNAKEHISPLRKKGITDFLVSTFISSPSANINSKDLINKLVKFPNVGTSIYGRKRSTRPPENKFAHMTILQLIASDLIQLQCAKDNPKAVLALGVCNHPPHMNCPSCLIESKWTSTSLVN